MQVRDLIEELKRFDPRAEVYVEYIGEGVIDRDGDVHYPRISLTDTVTFKGGDPMIQTK